MTTEAIDAAVELVREIDEESVEGTLELSTGVTIKPKRFPLWALRDAQRKIIEPQVPLVIIKDDDGEREEPNPSDPGYLFAKDEYENELSDVALNISLMLGCEVVSVPEDIPPRDSDEWIETLLFLKVLNEQEAQDIRSDPRRRKITWMRYYAIAGQEDIAMVMAGPMKKTLVSEADVSDSMRSFPNRKTRRANSRRATTENGADRN